MYTSAIYLRILEINVKELLVCIHLYHIMDMLVDCGGIRGANSCQPFGKHHCGLGRGGRLHKKQTWQLVIIHQQAEDRYINSRTMTHFQGVDQKSMNAYCFTDRGQGISGLSCQGKFIDFILCIVQIK